MAGTACANYLTPVVITLLPDGAAASAKYAIAFALGFMGLKGLELFIDKYLSKKEEDPEPVFEKTTKKRKKRKV